MWKCFYPDISIYTKAAEIYKRDSIKQNIETINHQARKGVQKAPLPGLSAYRDCRMGNNAMLYGQFIVNKKAVPIPFRPERKEQKD